jgi:hypothetical protein
MVTKVTAPPTDDLAALAAAVDAGPATAEQQEQAEQLEAEELQADQAMDAIKGVVADMTLTGLQAFRAKRVAKLPTLEGKWTDPMLERVAQAVPAVVEKHLGFLFKNMGQYPELGMLFFALLPMAGGYMAAVAEQKNRTVDEPRSA